MKIGWRIWLLIIALALSLLAIHPTFKSGVEISSIDRNSTAYEAGLRSGMLVQTVNGKAIATPQDYESVIATEFIQPNSTSKMDFVTDKGDFAFLSPGIPGLSVQSLRHTNIKTGLDLSGGARAIVRASNVSLTDAQLSDLIAITQARLNTFGLSDIAVRPVTDLEGNKFMLIEIAGATPQDVRELVGRQGVFTAKVGNVTVFEGSRGDITDVCRNDATCSGLQQCNPQQDGTYYCTFDFTLYLSEAAAERHAAVTQNVSLDSSGQYLTDKLYMYVDNIEATDPLSINVNLRGQKTTQISIQGTGTGATQEEAANDARDKMKKLQTILITGSLPYKLEIVKLDTISPSLGQQFIKTIFLAGIAAIIAVALIVFIRYRKIKESLAVLVTSFSEIIIILGVASFIRWNLDLPSIAGILATIGTGVDQQIVILDEARRGEALSMKEKMKHAIFIVMSAYMTVLVSMLPLYWAGAGLFKGFALTTIVGITAGVLISRPAFAEIIRRIEEKI